MKIADQARNDKAILYDFIHFHVLEFKDRKRRMIMKRILLLSVIILALAACGRQTQEYIEEPEYATEELEIPEIPYEPDITPEVHIIPEPSAPEPEIIIESVIDFTMAANLFSQAQDIWDADNGELWGIPLHAPLVIACALTREAVACQPLGLDFTRQTVGDTAIYAGTLPGGVLIGNTASRIRGQYAGMMTLCFMLGLDFDEREMLSILVHEGFHVIQPQLHGHTGARMLENVESEDAQNKFVLELAALFAAWNNTGDKRLANINDALYFRNSRRQTYQTRHENQLEIGEGLVVYTADLMLIRSRDEFSDYLAYHVERIANDTMAQSAFATALSWGYYSAPLYALLLDEFCTTWRTGEINRDTNLGLLLQTAVGIEELTPPTDMEQYGYTAITAATRERMVNLEMQILSALQALAQPQIRLTSMSGYGLEMDNVFFIPNGRVEDARPGADVWMITSGILKCHWGRLDLDYGYLRNNLSGDFRLSAPHFEVAENRIYGDGWTIELNDGWVLSQSPGGGGFVRRG